MMTEAEARQHFEENYKKYKIFVSTVLKSVCIEHGLRLTPHEAEEYIQISLLELYKCLSKYDPSRGIPFKNYAFLRVTGSFLDTQRKRSPIPRTQQKLYQKYFLYKSFCDKHGIIFNETDCAKNLEITPEELRAYVIKWNARNSVSMDNPDSQFEDGTNDSDPEKILLQSETESSILNSIDRLNEREKKVVTDIFFNDQNLSFVAGKLGLSESRVSQIKKQALLKLKKHCT